MRSKLGPRLVLMLLWGAFVVGVPGRALPHAGVENARIEAIELDCAAPIDRDGLLQIMPVHVGDALGADTLDRVRERLTQTELFTQIAVEAPPRGAGVAVVAHLVRKAIVNAVRFRGNHVLGDDELQRVARVHEGTAFTDDQREYAVSRLQARYAAEGFEAATVTIAVHPRSPGEVDVILSIAEGPALRISAIGIVGTLPLPQDEVRARIGLAVGDRYTHAQQRQAQTAIVRLLRQQRYYEAEVSSSWERAADYTGVLRFTVRPGPRFEVQFSGNDHFSDDKLLRLMDLPTRPIVTDGTWRELARRAQRAYQEAGYYLARVEVHVEPGPPKVVRFTVKEGERYRIAEVSFEGNHVLPAAQLRSQMATRPPSWVPWRRGVFLDDVFDEDLKRLWYFYRRQGFQSAEIVDARTRLDPERGAVFVTVFIEEGPRTVVRQIEEEGTAAIAGKRPDLRVAQNQPLDPEGLEADRRALLTAFAQNGYTHATVTARVTTQPERDGEVATVRFEAQPGEQQRIGTIIVQNNLDTRSRVITRELPFTRGDPLNPDALLLVQGNIYRLGLFRSVTVRPLDTPGNAAATDVGVNVSERPFGAMQWGAGYNTRDGIRGFTELSYNNLQGLGRRISLRGDFNFDPSAAQPNEYAVVLGFREPHLADTKWSVRADLIGQRSTRAVDQFSIERLAFIPAIERTFSPGLKAGVEFQYEDANVFDVKPDVLVFNPRDQGKLQTVSLGPYAVYDGRDDAFAPRRGIFDSVRLRWAPSVLGSDVPTVKLTVQHSQYVPLTDELTFVYAARAGWARALNAGEQVPIRERFFLGGRTTVRGFGENEVGPLGARITDDLGNLVHPGGDPLGGDLVMNLNVELRFPLLYGLSGAAFVDGGGAYLQDRPIRLLDDFRRSAGPGLRYNTPVGPISLDYGFKLDRRSGESIGEIHFSIGTIF